MSIYVLIMAYFFAGQTVTAVYSGGQSEPFEFISKTDCEIVKAQTLKELKLILPEGAQLRSLECKERYGKNSV